MDIQLPTTALEWAKFALYIVIALAFSMAAYHYFFAYYNNLKLLANPCQLCCDSNRGFECPKPRLLDDIIPVMQGGVR